MATRMRTTMFPVVALAVLALASPVPAQNIGPSTTTEPYILPNPALSPGTVGTTSILTAGDSVSGYKMVGIPDGLGALRSRGRTFTLLSNHELGPTQGVVRSHGSAGAFVARWAIDRSTLEVKAGQDQIKNANSVYSWDPVSATYFNGPRAFDRLCSADLPDSGAFSFGNLGTKERIFLGGEESRPPFAANYGRAWAHIVTGPNAGQVWQLPRLGQMSFETQLASPHPQAKTVVMLMDDAAASTAGSPLCETVNCPAPQTVPSELYVYVGTKQRQGTEIERAGLTNGTLFGMKVMVNGALRTEESDVFGLGGIAYIASGRFELVDLGDQSSKDGIQLQRDAVDHDVFRMQRVEDGAWDPRPRRRGDFYFVTTAA